VRVPPLSAQDLRGLTALRKGHNLLTSAPVSYGVKISRRRECTL
jgi:hypothetical protein